MGEGGVDRIENGAETLLQVPRSGILKGIPARRIFVLARARRWPIAAGETRKAEPIAAASRPRIVCSIKGARIDSSIAGWAQANNRASRRSGIDASASAAFSSSPIRMSVSEDASALRRRRAASMRRRRAAVASQPSGLSARPARPDRESGGEGVGERVLGPRHVARTRGEEGDELAVALARRAVRDGPSKRFGVGRDRANLVRLRAANAGRGRRGRRGRTAVPFSPHLRLSRVARWHFCPRSFQDKRPGGRCKSLIGPRRRHDLRAVRSRRV